jgi:hypothetical protein
MLFELGLPASSFSPIERLSVKILFLELCGPFFQGETFRKVKGEHSGHFPFFRFASPN